MRLGAYASVPDFAYPGWRLTVPGGPAGGHNKGFTHNYSVGTDLLPADQYEQDREDGMSSHDAAYASPRNPRGVYRSPGEVPPRPNASGSAMTYRGFQTKRHPGTSIAPGAFPADFIETSEDFGINGNGWTPGLHGLEFSQAAAYPSQPGNELRMRMYPTGAPPTLAQPIVVAAAPQPAAAPPPPMPSGWISLDSAENTVESQTHPDWNMSVVSPEMASQIMAEHPDWFGLAVPAPAAPLNTVTAPPAAPAPQPINTVTVPIVQPSTVSAAPAPSVASNVVIPLNDGSGNFVSVATGAIVPGSQVTLNPLTQQYNAVPAAAASGFSLSSIETWLTQPSSLFPSIPNWGLLLGAGVGAAVLLGHKGHR